MWKNYSIPSLIVATVLGSVFLFWGAVAHAQVVWENPNFSPYPNYETACAGECATSFLNTQDTFPYFSGWTWWTFIYSSSSVRTIDNINFGSYILYQNYGAVGNDGIPQTASARWEVYRTTSTTSVGDLIGFTEWGEIAELDYTYSITPTYKWYFTEPINIGGAYYYRFVLQLERGATATFSLDETTPNENVRVQLCTGEYAIIGEPIDDCEDNFDDYEYGGNFSRPVVILENGGTPLSGEYITTQQPCTTNSNTQPTNSCNDIPLTEVTVGGFVNIETANKKVSIYLQDKFLNNLDSVALYYTGAGYYTFEHTFTGLQASTTYNIQTCLSDASAFPEYATEPECTTQIFTNGDNPVSYEDYWCEMFPNECTASSTRETMWNNLECDAIGITDVKKGVQCALVWAFEPSEQSRQQFVNAKNAILYSVPLGYVTFIYTDVRNAFTSTSTSVFTREIEMGKYFGRPNTATTTISLEGLTEYVSIGDPIYGLIETIMWLAFAVWFIYWGLTRKL